MRELWRRLWRPGGAAVPSAAGRRTRFGRLEHELDLWSGAGLTARFWLRDDDAATDTPQLRRLLGFASELNVRVGLAVIPDKTDASLVSALAGAPACVWQHGWGHYWHTAGEFGEGRPLALMEEDALAGQRRLDEWFGPRGWQRVFVPPNHQLCLPFKERLADLGYIGLSAGELLTPTVSGLAEVNAEVDVMDWPAGSIRDAAAIEAMVLEQLQTRRSGEVPADRPVGLLTHHLVLDDDAWSLIQGLCCLLTSHGAVEFVDADGLFAQHTSVTARPAIERTPSPARSEAARVTVVLTSCGRQDLLVRTLDSFLQYNTYPIHELIVIEDGTADANRPLEERYRHYPMRWLATGTRIGQIATIDMAYRHVATEFIFHCEDDWQFTAPHFVEKSLAVLRSNDGILQVWIRALSDTNNHPFFDCDLYAGAQPYRLLQPDFRTDAWGTWHGFSFNPGLRRRRDYLRLGSYSSLDPAREHQSYELERKVSEYYHRQGLLAAILSDNDGKGYVEHLGWGRRVEAVAPGA